MNFKVDPSEEPLILESIQSSAYVTTTYLVLIVLSSMIASFGLLSNSAATVIGAMIVAPLMGPILGIAVGLVRGDRQIFWKALLAELLGVGLCLLTGMLISRLVGPSDVDFNQSEIASRTHPTLFDMAIGFSAGLAGAYATTNRKISASIAGVAIAVALVPPLCVSGLCLGAGQHEPALGAFVLFGSNFLTIQLAANVVFTLVGLGKLKEFREEHHLLQAFVVNLALLGLTGWFLAQQLQIEVTQRRITRIARAVVESEFSRVSGAHLDSLQSTLKGKVLRLDLLARAPEELSVAFASQLAKTLEQKTDLKVDLRIGTALASYVTPTGRLFEVDQATPAPSDLLQEQTRWALQQALLKFKGVNLLSFHQLSATLHGQDLFVSVQSPYTIGAAQVSRLQRETLSALRTRAPGQSKILLTVRTTLVQDYTAAGLQVQAQPVPVAPATGASTSDQGSRE